MANADDDFPHFVVRQMRVRGLLTAEAMKGRKGFKPQKSLIHGPFRKEKCTFPATRPHLWRVLNFADNFAATITTAAWRTKPSWMLVAGSDRTIHPELERWYAMRANSHTVEVAGASHSVCASHPKEVAEVIESAARAASK